MGLWLFGDLDWWECAVLASILAPTDIALSAAVVENPVVPERVRHALNVEAGLNDGVAVPLLLLFLAGATVTEGLKPGSFWATTTVEKVGIGVLAGVVVGVIAGELARPGDPTLTRHQPLEVAGQHRRVAPAWSGSSIGTVGSGSV